MSPCFLTPENRCSTNVCLRVGARVILKTEGGLTMSTAGGRGSSSTGCPVPRNPIGAMMTLCGGT
eukprot:7154590-Pyramimonas_sp.AAC.1